MDKFSRGICKEPFCHFHHQSGASDPVLFWIHKHKSQLRCPLLPAKGVFKQYGRSGRSDDDFGTGAFTMIVTEGLPYKGCLQTERKGRRC